MICDIIDVTKYKMFRYKPGPYLITFYEKDADKKNYKLYEYLKSFEKDFNEVPIIRFDYRKFIGYYLNETIPSPNHILVINNFEMSAVYDTKDLSIIPILLGRIIGILYKNRTFLDTDGTMLKANKRKPWSPNSSHIKVSYIYTLCEIPVEEQYKFPNSTSVCSSNKKYIKCITTKRKEISLSQSNISKKEKINYKPKYNFSKTDHKMKDNSNTFVSKSKHLSKFSNLHKNKTYRNTVNKHLHNKPSSQQNYTKNKIQNSKINTNFLGCNEIVSNKIFKEYPNIPILTPQNNILTPITSLETFLKPTYRELKCQSSSSENFILLNKSPQKNVNSSFICIQNGSYSDLTQYPSIFGENASEKIQDIIDHSFLDKKHPINGLCRDFKSTNNILDLPYTESYKYYSSNIHNQPQRKEINYYTIDLDSVNGLDLIHFRKCSSQIESNS